jgi:hypothetical protein
MYGYFRSFIQSLQYRTECRTSYSSFLLPGNPTTSHTLYVARIQDETDLALKSNAIIETLCAMHRAFKSWDKVDVMTNSTVRVHEAEFLGTCYCLVLNQIGVLVKIRCEFRGCIGNVKAHEFVIVGGPVSRKSRMHDGFPSSIVVAGQIRRHTRNI